MCFDDKEEVRGAPRGEVRRALRRLEGYVLRYAVTLVLRVS